MSDLPVADLETYDVADHRVHHALLHGVHRALAMDGEVGMVVGKTSAGSTTSVLTAFYPHYTFDDQRIDIVHSTTGPLSITVARATKVVVVAASANITAVNVANLVLLGDTFATVNVVIKASVPIALNWNAGDLLPLGVNLPSALAAGETVRFPAVSVTF